MHACITIKFYLLLKEMMCDIFISAVVESEAITVCVDKIHDQLREKGLKVYLDRITGIEVPPNLKGSERDDALLSCKVIVLTLTKKYVRFAHLFLNMAVSQTPHKQVIPVQLESDSDEESDPSNKNLQQIKQLIDDTPITHLNPEEDDHSYFPAVEVIDNVTTTHSFPGKDYKLFQLVDLIIESSGKLNCLHDY